ncbi:MAG TPA: hypothetical protein PKZ17_05200 [Thermodesulfovibrio thiophilus]|uniref:hypothetical protein n=1 Tax=Thermodesulfovibrio thiophilus TaxID=340095 RepID=UPI0017A09EE1|nr:hypothetical protein [Thermodesulfovibrio thiophilus]HHW21036.1 hypothetical protein [Thermodesulfovibrio thiophilus]HOA83629.1 hypothetical protein [Thermodesulfovibrio thiophilus]HQA04120.1 hypothetical protein [Thermodesulfovibrio thiophilus]HQD36589.1 hypothetical protein [Thermodesulfovibrio thiophilus]
MNASVKKNSYIMHIVLIILSLCTIFSILWIRSNVISLEYRLSNLEDKKKEILRERRMLLAEKSSLTSFVRLDNVEGHLLVFPDRKKVVYIYGNPENVVKVVNFNKKN